MKQQEKEITRGSNILFHEGSILKILDLVSSNKLKKNLNQNYSTILKKKQPFNERVYVFLQNFCKFEVELN